MRQLPQPSRRSQLTGHAAPLEPSATKSPTMSLEGTRLSVRTRPEEIRDVATEPSCECAGEEVILADLLAHSQSGASASALLQHFPSLGHVLAAEPSQLRAFGLTPHDVALLRSVREAARRLARGEVRHRPVLGNWHALIAYLQTTMAHEQIEQFRVLFLDRKNNLIVDEVQQQGTVSHTPVYPREVMKRALILNASALIVAHNHPSGDSRPSREDIEMTRQLKAAAEALDFELHDHVVIGHGTHSSFRSLGLI